MSLIDCRDCDSSRCNGCNIYILATMLNQGKLDCLMDDHHTITINPEELRPKGEWIRPTKINGRSFNIPHCSVCEGVPCGVDENTRYCPNCGAKMEVT